MSPSNMEEKKSNHRILTGMLMETDQENCLAESIMIGDEDVYIRISDSQQENKDAI